MQLLKGPRLEALSLCHTPPPCLSGPCCLALSHGTGLWFPHSFPHCPRPPPDTSRGHTLSPVSNHTPRHRARCLQEFPPKTGAKCVTQQSVGGSVSGLLDGQAAWGTGVPKPHGGLTVCSRTHAACRSGLASAVAIATSLAGQDRVLPDCCPKPPFPRQAGVGFQPPRDLTSHGTAHLPTLVTGNPRGEAA